MTKPELVVWEGGEWVWSVEHGDWLYVPHVCPVAAPVNLAAAQEEKP